MTTRKPMLIGPFSRGLNTFDDPTAIHDQECAEATNFDPGLDGSLRSRPPFTDTGTPMTASSEGTPRLLGYFYDANGLPYLIASDGSSSTWYYFNNAWTLITGTFAASDMVQFDGKAWLLAPVGETEPGGYWTPTGVFTADADMPKGTSITTYKARLWIAEGLGGLNPTRIRYSKVLGQPNFWANPGFLDVGSGDGETVVKIVTYFDTMLVFRTKSIWNFQYGIDPAQAILSVIVPGVGLQSKYALVAHENYLYFMYDEKAYQFVNNRVQQINIKVPFVTMSPGAVSAPYTVSLFNNRVLYSFYETIYVYSLRTQTWTTWKSDAWGAIGQLLMPYVDDDTDIAYALPTTPVEAGKEERRNLDTNPRGVSSGSMAPWGARWGWVRSFFTTESPPTGLPFSSVVRYTSSETGGASGRGVDSYGNVEASSPGTTGSWADSPFVVPTQTLRISRYARISGAGTTEWQLKVRFHDRAGNWVGQSVSGAVVSSSGWARPYWFGEVPEGASGVSISTQITNSRDVTTSTFLDVTGAMIEVVEGPGIPKPPALLPTPGTYFDGSFTDTYELDYLWDGSANSSSSRVVTRSFLPLLKIEDKVTTDKEDMLCVLQTKNYNFDVPGSFKVLFWWGLDAIFRTNVQGQVIPGVFNLSTTWGQVRTKTWGDLQAGTWKFPYMSDPSVVTDVSAGAGPRRKFVKFLKKLRFRQVQFRVAFRIDGSGDTAPAQIFTLSSYMAEKQTVSKQIS